MKKRNRKFYGIFLIFCSLQLSAQQPNRQTFFSIVFYNVENLFDTINDPQKNDDEFLPQASKKWNTYTYYTKLKHISQTIVAAGNWHTPDIIGLAEIENQSCLWALTHHTNLSRIEYDFIHFDSPDERGIDVAMLYNPKTFVPLTKQAIPIHFTENPKSKTRDILYVKGKIIETKDTLHVFVCHFPSRMGGQSKSEPKRIFAAQVLRNTIDSIQQINKLAHIVVIGDFNDYPTNRSITDIIKAQKSVTNCDSCLVNVLDTSFYGTHAYKGEWNFLDQSIISSSLFKNYRVINYVVRNDFLLKEDKKSTEKQPFRTYRGQYYQGGYSDHLPILVELFRK